MFLQDGVDACLSPVTHRLHGNPGSGPWGGLIKMPFLSHFYGRRDLAMTGGRYFGGMTFCHFQDI